MVESENVTSLILHLKALSPILKPLSVSLHENNSKLITEIAKINDAQLYTKINSALLFTLQLVQYKQLIGHSLGILNTSIICVKSKQTSYKKENKIEEQRNSEDCFEKSTSESEESKVNEQQNSKYEIQSKEQALKHFKELHYEICLALDILTVCCTYKENQELSLRILQTAFTLNGHEFITVFDEIMVTKMLSIFFEFCTEPSMLQNISISALFAFVEGVDKVGQVEVGLGVLEGMLEYLIEGKRFVWVKGEVKGLIWDLVVTIVKHMKVNHILEIEQKPKLLEKIAKMYKIVCENIFSKNNKAFLNQTTNVTNTPLSQRNFLRYLKAYFALSYSFSIHCCRVLDHELLPFRCSIPNFLRICELERNSKMYMFLETACLLLLSQHVIENFIEDMPLVLEKGMVFVEVINKVSEELCYGNESLEVNWEGGQKYIEKITNDEPNVRDGDFVRLIKNTVISLRENMEKDGDIGQCKNDMKSLSESSKGSNISNDPKSPKKWEFLLNNILKTIRYLSSIKYTSSKYKNSSSNSFPFENAYNPTLDLLIEMQHWFILCPIGKVRNLILQELLLTSTIMTNQYEALKVSQCVQIVSNILFGYFDDLDSIGLGIIMKMISGVKIDWEDGKSFEELDEIYNLCCEIFEKESFVKCEADFIKIIQGFIQCINSLVADLEMPKEKNISLQESAYALLKRTRKMVQFLIDKMLIVLKNHNEFVLDQWNSISAFFLTLCWNKNLWVREAGVRGIGVLVKNFMKGDGNVEVDGREAKNGKKVNESNDEEGKFKSTEMKRTVLDSKSKKECTITGLYLELCKSQISELTPILLEQLKSLTPRLTCKESLMEIFRIIKILSNFPENTKEIVNNIHEFQEIAIRECIFRVTDLRSLKMIIAGIEVRCAGKNEEYRVINVLWYIGDYVKKINLEGKLGKGEVELWEALFKNIWIICENTKECETQQAAIHTMTQILGEISSFTSLDFILDIMSKYYHEILLLLLGIHSLALEDSEKSAETAKVAFKNYIKINRKLISLENLSEDNKEKIGKSIADINGKINKYLQKCAQSADLKKIKEHFLWELLIFIEQLQRESEFEPYGIDKDLDTMINNVIELLQVCEKMPKCPLNLNSHIMKKKVLPLIDKIEGNRKSKKVKDEKQN